MAGGVPYRRGLNTKITPLSVLANLEDGEKV